MNRTYLFPAWLFALVIASSPAQVQAAQASPPAKGPDVITALAPALSPALSADQIAKQRLAQAAVTSRVSRRATSAGPGVKPEPAFTALPPIEGFALRVHDPATPASIVRSGASGAALTKPQALTTTLPLAPDQAAAEVQRRAHKLDHARSEISPRPVSKPGAHVTRGPAPATLAPSQAAKHAQDASRRPQ